MVLITDRAALELQRILRSNMARPRQGVRLQLNAVDQLSMSIDVAHLGDSVFRRDHEPLLIVEPGLSARLARRTLDFGGEEGARRTGFTLGWLPTTEPSS